MKTYLEEAFLTSIIELYSYDDEFKNITIDKSLVEKAVIQTLNYLKTEDDLNQTNHVEIFKKIFIEHSVNTQNCSSQVGISIRTFYRYKQRYLQVFKFNLLSLVS